MSYPTDLDERIKKYLQDNKEEWKDNQHHIYIYKNILVIDEWRYKCNPPSPKQLDIPKLKILLIKNE